MRTTGERLTKTTDPQAHCAPKSMNRLHGADPCRTIALRERSTCCRSRRIYALWAPWGPYTTCHGPQNQRKAGGLLRLCFDTVCPGGLSRRLELVGSDVDPRAADAGHPPLIAAQRQPRRIHRQVIV